MEHTVEYSLPFGATSFSLHESLQTFQRDYKNQGLSQDLKSGCPKLTIVKYLGVQLFKADNIILRLQPCTCIYLLNMIKHDVHIHCLGNFIEVENLQLYA